MFPAVFWAQVAASVRLVDARSGYIVSNIQFPKVALAMASMFSCLKIHIQTGLGMGTYQSQLVEVPNAVRPEHAVI